MVQGSNFTGQQLIKEEGGRRTHFLPSTFLFFACIFQVFFFLFTYFFHFPFYYFVFYYSLVVLCYTYIFMLP